MKILSKRNLLFSLASIAFMASPSAISQEVAYKTMTGWKKIDSQQWPKQALQLNKPARAKKVNNITRTITYLDINNNTGAGFDDPVDGATRQATFEAAVDYALGVLGNNGSVDIEVQISESDGTGALATGGTLYFVSSGFVPGMAFSHITSGVDPLGSVPDITVTVDFGHNFNSTLGDPAGNQSDLYSVIVHEITHGLGITSLLNGNGSSAIGGGYSTFDQLLQRSTNTNMFDGSGNFIGSTSDLTSNQIVFNGGNAQSSLGSKPPVHSPAPFSGSSLAHWDRARTEALGQQAVMTEALVIGTKVRTFANYELQALRDIGYSIGGVVNAAPTISNINDFSVNEDNVAGPIAFTLSDSDTPTSALSVSAQSSNTALIANSGILLSGSGANRTVTITPIANKSGTSTITLTVFDGTSSASDSFVVTVLPINDAPTIGAIATITLSEGSASAPIALSLNDVETPNSLTVTASSSNTTLIPNNSNNLTITGSGLNQFLTITPAANENGSATITVSVSDGTLSNSTNFTVNVNAVDNAPTINAVSNQTIDEDTSLSNVAITVADPDTDINTLVLSASSNNSSLVTNGNIQLGGSGANRTLSLTPTANAFGQATITLSLTDGTNTVTRTFTVQVNNVNDKPIANADSAIVNKGNSVTINVLANDTDIDGNNDINASSLVASSAQNGTVTLQGGQLTYTPDANFAGNDSFTYTVADLAGAVSDPASVSITVTNNNNPPVISGTPPSKVIVGQTYQFTPSVNDIDGDTLTLSAQNLPTWLSFDANTGNITGVPSISDAGNYTNISIRVTDGTSTVSLPTFSIFVDLANHAPVAKGESFTLEEGGLLSVPTNAGLLVNDIDEDNDALTVELVKSPTNSINFQLNADGSFTYQHNGEEKFSDTFTYRVSDGELLSDTVTVTLTITAKNDLPEITSSPIENLVVGDTFSYTVSVKDNDDTNFSFSLTQGPSFLSFKGNTLSGTAPVSSAGQYSITLTVNDGEDSVTQTFNLTVTDKPVIVDQLSASFSSQVVKLGNSTQLSVSYLPGDINQNELTVSLNVPASVLSSGCTDSGNNTFSCLGSSALTTFSFSVVANSSGDVSAVITSAFAETSASFSVVENTVSQANTTTEIANASELISTLNDIGNLHVITNNAGQQQLLVLDIDSLTIANSLSLGTGRHFTQADFNNDGTSDLVTVTSSGTDIKRGTGNSFTLLQTLTNVVTQQIFESSGTWYLLGTTNDNIVVYRFNGSSFIIAHQETLKATKASLSRLDGAGTSSRDLIALDASTGTLSIFVDFFSQNLSRPTQANKAANVSITVNSDALFSLVDTDKDGADEILLTKTNSGGTGKELFSLSNNGSTLTSVQRFGDAQSSQVVANDFNGDSRTDLAFANDNGLVQIYFKQANGGFTLSETSISASPFPLLATADFNSDGIGDLAVYDQQTRQLQIYRFGNNVVGAAADFALETSTVESFTVNQASNVTFTGTNFGPDQINELTISLTLSSGLTISSATLPANCSRSGLEITCSDIPAQSVIDFSLRITPSQSGSKSVSLSSSHSANDDIVTNDTVSAQFTVQAATQTPTTNNNSSSSGDGGGGGSISLWIICLLLSSVSVRNLALD